MSIDQAIAKAVAQANQGQLDAAIASLRLIIQRDRTNVMAHQALGTLLLRKGQVDQALYMMKRGVELAPSSAPAHNNLGYALMQAGRVEEAVKTLRESVRLDPSYGLGWGSLCTALTNFRHYLESAEAGRRATELLPDLPEARLNRFIAILETGETDQAVQGLREAHARFPDHEKLHSTMLMGMQYSDRITDAELFAAHAQFGARRPIRGQPARTNPDPERRLRVGILSGDLGAHSVGYFLEPLLTHLDRAPFEIHCYASGKANDATTARMRALADGWVDASTADDAALDALIRKGQIDILLELGGHTGSGRIAALINKPAPIIITAIGYPDTTGLPAVDYRLVDSLTDPPGAEARATENLLRLDPCFLCYRPLEDSPDVSPPPSAAAGHITFGSFNTLAKLSQSAVQNWAEILNRVPGSRLFLKSTAFEDPEIHPIVRARFQQHGIDPSRIDLLGLLPTSREHMAAYSRIDIALDTFPYNGTTTTCEALWMGVPVIAVEGTRHVGRVGASLLHAAGLPELLAPDRASFVKRAVELASDPARLASLRASMRQRLRASPLCDQTAYAQRFGQALRQIWRQYCAG